MKLTSPKQKINYFLKTNFNEISLFLKNKKKKTFVILFVFIITSGYANSRNMTCALPVHNLVEKTLQRPKSYIKLSEPKTTIQLDVSRRVEKFSSPGCHKTEAVTLWTNSLEIECNSNDGTAVTLQINFSTSKFDKTYMQKNQKIRSHTGFCSRLND